MRALILAGFVVTLVLTLSGCYGYHYHTWMCPRCGPVERASMQTCRIEPLHHLDPGIATMPGVWIKSETCDQCGEIVDRFTSDPANDFLEPVRVTCESSGQSVTVVREAGFPWAYVCPACRKPVILRPVENK